MHCSSQINMKHLKHIEPRIHKHTSVNNAYTITLEYHGHFGQCIRQNIFNRFDEIDD